MGRRRVAWHGPGGWVLMEVMAAVVLLAIFMGSMTPLLAGMLQRAEYVHGSATWGSPAIVARSTWEWAEGRTEASWRPGPVLSVRASIHPAAGQAMVGVWVDGWLVQEKEVDGTGTTSIGSAVWGDRVGAEVVVRVRSAGKVWGPPWRTMVPDTAGVVDGSVVPETGAAPALAVVRVPVAATPRIDGLGGAGVEPSPGGVSFLVTGPFESAGVRVGDGEQWWRCDAGRSLDVYF